MRAQNNEALLKQLNDAVSVIVLSPEIRKFLTAYDPKALDQCFAAFNAYRNSTKNEQ
jgi:hypothetical protein